jgi:hypothetical protein
VTTIEHPPSSTRSPTAAPAPPRLRRRPAYAFLGVALVASGGLAAAWLVTAADATTDVVVAADTIYRGQVIERSDLETASMSGLETGATVPAEQLEQFVGTTAAVDAAAGTPLSPGIAADPLPRAGESIVGLLLAPGQLPSVELRPGDPVRVVATARAQDDPPTTPPTAIAATVVGTTMDEMSGGTVVNLSVRTGDAGQLAALSGTGRVALVLDAAVGGAD